MSNNIIRIKNVPSFFGFLIIFTVVLFIILFRGSIRKLSDQTFIQELANKVGAADQTIYVTMYKTAVSTQSYISAYGNIPDGKDFINDIPMAYPALDIEDPGCKSGDDTCLFGVKGTVLPIKCNDTYYRGYLTDDNQCYFYYERLDLNDDGIKDFRITGKAHLKVNKLFIYESQGQNSGKIKSKIL